MALMLIFGNWIFFFFSVNAVYGNIAVFGDTNLELPSFLSNRSAVEVHMDVGHDLLLGPSKESTINLELPLHARYPVSEEHQ